MLDPSIFWLWFAGSIFLLAGLFAVRKELTLSHGLDKLAVLGPVFVAAPLALFGAEHFVAARFIVQAVPAWMPWRMFWVYFVGAALFAAATSLILKKHVRWSAALFGIMLCIFVLLVHLPVVQAKPGDRFPIAVAIRDFTFAVGAFAFARAQAGTYRSGSDRIIDLCRWCVAIAVIFFGVEHLLHPEFAPGVPLPKVTPDWYPLHSFWGYPVGVIQLAAGAALLFNMHPRAAAELLGLAMTLVTVFIYVPILAAATPQNMTEGLNYVADTLLFAGTFLLLASALPAAGGGSADMTT